MTNTSQKSQRNQHAKLTLHSSPCVDVRCLTRIQIPSTIAPMASPVATFRTRSFGDFLFHCSSSTCLTKCICSRERPSLVGSILRAKGAPDSLGILSAMSGFKRRTTVGERTADCQTIYCTVDVQMEKAQPITKLSDLRFRKRWKTQDDETTVADGCKCCKQEK